jgi:hypothetical protein
LRLRQLDEEKRKAKQAVRVEKDRRKSAMLSTMSIIEQITNPEAAADNGAEEVEMNEQLVEVDILKTIKTKLANDAVNCASTIYLQMDLILALVYTGCLLSGCRWIFLSDLFRWYREGRFCVTQTQLQALTFTVLWDKDASFKSLRHRARSAKEALYSGVQPLCESVRCVAFITQITRVPRHITLNGSFDLSTSCLRLKLTQHIPSSH